MIISPIAHYDKSNCRKFSQNAYNKNIISPVFGAQNQNDSFEKSLDCIHTNSAGKMFHYCNSIFGKILMLIENPFNTNNKDYDCIQETEIDKGLTYKKIILNKNSRKIKINLIEADRSKNPDIKLKLAMAPGNMHSKDSVSNILSKEKGLIGVNGSYFRNATGTPLGILKIDGDLITGPIKKRVCFAVSDKEYKIGKSNFNASLKTDKCELKIDTLNQPRISDSQVILYDSKWGDIKFESEDKKFVNVVIKDNRIENITDKSVKIPENGYVISVSKDKIKDFRIGEKVKTEYSLSDDFNEYDNIISGGPYLMREGKIYNDTKEEDLLQISGKNPRTAIGYTKDNVLKIVMIEGRREGSSGVTINELSEIMEDLGCYEAINLDGGSSSAMCINNHILNYNDAKESDKVNNAIVIKI